jgi:hypothetical protein
VVVAEVGKDAQADVGFRGIEANHPTNLNARWQLQDLRVPKEAQDFDTLNLHSKYMVRSNDMETFRVYEGRQRVLLGVCRAPICNSKVNIDSVPVNETAP